MMDIVSLKRYIFEKEKIEYILQEIGCHNIKYHNRKEFYSCSNFNGDNPSAINIKNNQYLSVVNWTRQNDFRDGSDIITLVQYNKKYSFVEAVKYLHDVLGLEYKLQRVFQKKEEKKSDPLDIFKRVRTAKKRIDVEDIHVLDEEILDEYVPLLHIDWYRDGIAPWTAKKFNLAYSYKNKRVIIPFRYWLTGDLLGINARTTIKNYKELGIKKYFLTPDYQKNLNLFGLYENYDAIQRAGYVVVFESEKSVLKRDSLSDSTGVALSGHTMSEEQIAILVGLNVEIIIALDNDIPTEEVRHMCSKFYRIRNVSYIKDSYGLLKDKDAAADASNKIYQFLFKHRVKYDEHEHSLYLKSLNKK